MITAANIDNELNNLAEYLGASGTHEELARRQTSVLNTCADVDPDTVYEFFEKSFGAPPEMIGKLFTAFQAGAYIATLHHKSDVEWKGGPSDSEVEKADREAKDAIEGNN